MSEEIPDESLKFRLRASVSSYDADSDSDGIPSYLDPDEVDLPGNPGALSGADTDNDGIPTAIDPNEFKTVEEQTYDHYLEQSREDQSLESQQQLVDLAKDQLEDKITDTIAVGLGAATAPVGGGIVAGAYLAVDNVYDTVGGIATGVDDLHTLGCYELQAQALERLGDGEDAGRVIEFYSGLACDERLGAEHSVDFESLQQSAENAVTVEEAISNYDSITDFPEMPDTDRDGVPTAVDADPYDFDADLYLGQCDYGTSVTDFESNLSDSGFDSGGYDAGGGAEGDPAN